MIRCYRVVHEPPTPGHRTGSDKPWIVQGGGNVGVWTDIARFATEESARHYVVDVHHRNQEIVR